jgi:predicted Co/Zn/Cd cation transporter (cation efflux family)
MEWVPIILVLIYFGIGLLLTNLLEDTDDDIRMFIFMVWPMVLGIGALIILIGALLAFIDSIADLFSED